jgi:restriction endonuclease Mrr
MVRESAESDFPYGAPEYLSPVLAILSDGNDHPIEEIRENILAKFPLTPAQLTLRRPSYPITVFVNKVAYAFARLVFHNAIVRVEVSPESYRITEHGRYVLSRRPNHARERDL